MLKVAIIGIGQIAEAHIGELKKIDSAEIIALCDLHDSPLVALREKYAISNTFTSSAEMLEAVKPDVVHITTPPGTHDFLARQAIAAGAHVYIEKPFTVTYDEAESLLQFAEEKGKKVCLGTNHIFSRAQKMATSAISQESFGGLTHIDSIFSYDLQGIFGKQVISNPEHWIAQLPGQVFQNNLNHPLAPITPYLSDDFEVRAWADDWTGNGVVFEELRVEIIDKQNQFTAYIVFSSNVKPGAFRISYFGRKKALFLNNNTHTFIEDSPARVPGSLGQILAIRRMVKSLRSQFWRNLRDFVLGKETYFSDMRQLFESFYAAIECDLESPTPKAEILRASRIIDEIVHQIGRPGRAVYKETSRL